MGWLSGAMDDCMWTQLLDQRIHTGAVSNVELMMNKPSHSLDQPLLIEASITLGSKDDRSLIIVDSVNLETPGAKVHASLRADET